MTLAQALRLKNRLTRRIGELGVDIRNHNSYPEQNEPEIDVVAVWTQRQHLIKDLIRLKCAIMQANRPIQSEILELSEVRSSINFLQTLDTTRGQTAGHRWEVNAAPVTMTAQLTKGAVDTMIKAFRKRETYLQDRISEFNAQTQVEGVPSIDLG